MYMFATWAPTRPRINYCPIFTTPLSPLPWPLHLLYPHMWHILTDRRQHRHARFFFNLAQYICFRKCATLSPAPKEYCQMLCKEENLKKEVKEKKHERKCKEEKWEKWKLCSSVKYTHRRAGINANTLPYLAREKIILGREVVRGRIWLPTKV
jgi:hypothetical protein